MPFRERDGLAIFVDGLPVDVPIGDANQPAASAVGQHGPGFHQLADVVRVRIDGEHVDVDGQRERIGDGEGAIAGRDVDRAIMLELHEHGEAGGRVLGEVEPDFGLHGFRLAGGLQMQIDD